MRQEVDIIIGLAVIAAGTICLIVGSGLVWMGIMALLDG